MQWMTLRDGDDPKIKPSRTVVLVSVSANRSADFIRPLKFGMRHSILEERRRFWREKYGCRSFLKARSEKYRQSTPPSAVHIFKFQHGVLPLSPHELMLFSSGRLYLVAMLENFGQVWGGAVNWVWAWSVRKNLSEAKMTQI